ncbi:MAG TPA: thioredoxin [Clostridiales bacterium]|nr:thioredoxin [Clostridiales bacterium]
MKNPIGKTAATSGSGLYQTAEFDLDATNSFDLDVILSHNLPVIIDFGADTCIPCKEMAPILLELNQELRGRAVVKFVDVWKDSAAGQVVPLEVIPTQFFFNADGSPYVPADMETAAANGFIMYTMKDTGEHVYTAHQGGMDKDTILAVLEEMGMK